MFEEFEGIDEDDEIAFVMLQAKEQKKLDDALENADNNEDTRWLHIRYMNSVLAIAAGLELPYFNSWTLPDIDDAYKVTSDFEYVVQSYVTQVKIRKTRARKVYSVTLDDVTKAKIHFFIDQIREHLNKSNLVERKKNSLFAKLNAFSADVDRVRTKFDNAMLVAIDIAHVVREYGDALKPVKELIDSVTELMGAAKSSEPEQSQLPPPAEHKKIEAPRKQLRGQNHRRLSRGTWTTSLSEVHALVTQMGAFE